MRTVSLHLRSDGVTADSAYARISDFARYPELTEAVLAVDVADAEPVEGVAETSGAQASVVSTWLVRFRKGQLKWTERDLLDPVARRIEFDQVTGDFAVMRGSWQVEEDGLGDGAGVLVRFDAEFDLGIPTLADILDPVAEATLRSNVALILTGLLGEVREVEPVAGRG